MNPDKVDHALKALISIDELNTEEQELYFEKLAKSHRNPSTTEAKFFSDLRARGDLVGMDDSGRIVFGELASEIVKAKSP